MPSINYEWDIETVDRHGDILDHHHAVKLNSLPALEPNQELVLVRDLGTPFEGTTDREWAYVENGLLPEIFDGGSRVPQRFHRELAKRD